MEYDNTNTGALWKNDSQTAGAPQYKGHINIDGVETKISAWVNKSDNPKAPKVRLMKDGVQNAQKKQTETSVDNTEEDIPF